MRAHICTAAVELQKWESDTYFFIIFLAGWLSVLTVVVGGGPGAGVHLSVFRFTLLIGPRPRRAQREGLRLLNATLDLHLPLHCLGKDEEKKGKEKERI